MTVPAEPVTVGSPNQEEHVDAQDGTSASQFALALKPFAVLVLMIKNTYSLSDSTLKLLLLTMVMLIRIVGVAFKIDNSNIQAFVEVFPTTEYQLRSLTSCSEKGFFQIICCPKCRKLYDVMNKWTIYAHSKEADFLCDHVKFPEHPHQSRRKKCASMLLQKVSTGSAFVFRPLKVFPYRGLLSPLVSILQRSDILNQCNDWPQRLSKNASLMVDIYDGDIWKDFHSVQGQAFLSEQNNLGLILNVDWFRPFEHSQYSIGVIYFALLNLPREVRYLSKNIIIAGIIPGPNEPSQVMNTFLEPLVADLNALWKGVYISVPSHSHTIRIRAALLCVSCDIPACRKVCGFLGHNSNLACSKCNCFFPGNVSDGFNFSGYDTLQWTPRSMDQHLESTRACRSAQTATARQSLESQHGARYSVLLELPYFDIVRQHAIDPMHNLFLGIAKHTITIWKAKYWSTAKTMEEIQAIVDSFQVPSGIGRIPGRISSGFSGFSADQWKHWILLYSLVAVKGKIPEVDYNLWAKFVRACSIICSPVLAKDMILDAHQLLVSFCSTFQEIYGATSCTINMHLSCHLQQCLQDFGPSHTFWCFGFERMNGVLGSLNTNSHSVELQLMRRIVDREHFATVAQSLDCADDLQAIYDVLVQSSRDTRGTVNSNLFVHTDSLMDCNIGEFVLTYNGIVELSGLQPSQAMTAAEHSELEEICRRIFGPEFVSVCVLYNPATQLSFLGQKYGTQKSRLFKSSVVQAHSMTASLADVSVGQIVRFLTLSVELHTTIQLASAAKCVHLHFADIMWFDAHPETDLYPEPLRLWYNLTSTRSFIPVAFFTTRVATCPVKVANEFALVSAPLIQV